MLNEEARLKDPTVLDAVNSILSSVGEGAVNSLVDLSDIDAINALVTLKTVNKSFQARGWSFNTFDDYVLTPDAINNRIIWTPELLSLKSTDYTIIKRNNYVYNLDEQKYTWSKPITVEAILQLDFSALPIQAQEYIIALASSRFAARYLGDDSLSKLLNVEAQYKWMEFNEYEHTIVTSNILSNTYISGVKER